MCVCVICWSFGSDFCQGYHHLFEDTQPAAEHVPVGFSFATGKCPWGPCHVPMVLKAAPWHFQVPGDQSAGLANIISGWVASVPSAFHVFIQLARSCMKFCWWAMDTNYVTISHLDGRWSWHPRCRQAMHVLIPPKWHPMCQMHCETATWLNSFRE